jgi:hypothetical protein
MRPGYLEKGDPETVGWNSFRAHMNQSAREHQYVKNINATMNASKMDMQGSTVTFQSWKER